MPLTRSPEQVVYEGLEAKWNADSDKWGQGTAGVKVFSLYRDRGSLPDDRRQSPFYAIVTLAFQQQTPLSSSLVHGLVIGRIRLKFRRDMEESKIDQIADAIRSALHKVDLYRSLVDVDYRPGYCTITGVLRTVDIGQHECVYEIPFAVPICKVAGTDKPQLMGDMATITYTPGSGGVAMIVGLVESLEHSVSMDEVDCTPGYAPNDDQPFPGARSGTIDLRMTVTADTSASSGTPNPRIPDGVIASLTIYKNGSSGQSWTENVFIQAMRHSVGIGRGQVVTYRMRRTGATVETLS